MDIRAEILIRAQHLGVNSDHVAFSDKLIWIAGSDGQVRLRKAALDLRSRRVTLYTEAMKSRWNGDEYEQGVLKVLSDGITALREFDESEHPRDEGGKFTDAGGGSEGGSSETGGGKGKLGPGYSEHAKLVNGVIHTSNVYDAVLALSQDRKVELKQPKQLSTLVKKLGEITKEMVDKGEKAPTFDLCKVTVKGTNLFCADTKGIPRVKMPQLDDDQTKAFVKHLKDEGYEVTKEKEKSENLRATQNQLDGAKVAKIAERIRKDPDRENEKRLVVSRDDYILDGHHHWAAQIALDAKDNKLGDHKTKISRVDISITKLLEEAEKFTGGKGHKDVADKDWNEEDHPRDEDGKFTFGGGGPSESDEGAYGGLVMPPAAPEAAPEAKPSGGGKSKGKATKEDFDKADINLRASKEKEFLETWNDKVGMAPEEFRESFLGGINATMSIRPEPYGNNFEVSGQVLNDDDDPIGTYEREVKLDQNSAYSAYFKVDDRYAKHGLGKKMLAGNIATYKKLGIDKVTVTAGLTVGGYAWAKYGYVPNRDSWDALRRALEREYTGSSSSSPRPSRAVDTYEADDWDQLSSDQQQYTEDAWITDTHSEFMDSEIENWRDSGQALQQEKSDLAYRYENNGLPQWAKDAIKEVRDTREEKGDPPIPFTDDQLYGAIEVAEYNSRYDDGKDDPDISFDDAQLTQPAGYDPAQGTLPGIEPLDPASFLNEEMREQLTDALISNFNDTAQSNADDAQPPDYLDEQVREYQGEYWDGMDDSERLRHAITYGLADIEIEPDPDAEEPQQEMELPKPEAGVDPVLAAIRSPNPKSIWKVADSPAGKRLLLGKGWSGKLDLKDKETMDRFDKYVGRAA